jgi:hypothetical protein
VRVPDRLPVNPERRDGEDPLGPFRGIVLGVALGALLWAAIVTMALIVLGRPS